MILKENTKNIVKAIGITTATLGTIHLINKGITSLAIKNEMLYECTGNFYSWRLGNIYYTKRGTGSPILLIHDLTSASSHYEFKKIERKLSKHYTVYCIDLLGCGRSDKPNMTYTAFLYVQLIQDFIKHVIREKVSLVTSGKSCGIGIMNSSIYSEFIEKLILINPVNLKLFNQRPTYQHKLVKAIFNLPIIGTLFYNMKVSRIGLLKDFHDYYISDSSYPIDHIINAYSEAAHIGGYQAKYVYSSIIANYTNLNVMHALYKLSLPIYLICGDEVRGINSTIAQYKSCNDYITIAKISNTKGLPHIEKPDKVNEYLQAICSN